MKGGDGLIALYIGLAGMCGALVRYAIGVALESANANGSAAFPLATLLINLLGSFALAWLLHAPIVNARMSERWRTTIGTGFIGAFTTFSTFSVETVALLDSHAWSLAVLYVALSVIGGLAFAWLGGRLAVTAGERRDRV
ncbi:fluoride efflux transporter CrcB [Paenibacillus sp. HJGM_3]|uniref:fluoride efflux transporter CrcB n=1 Tax=Paenibacillus sp. HJGM_3 TaxID=3379816 RepID=UPI00385AD88D